MAGPHTLIDRSIPLDQIVGKPTGQGFGAARKGPSVTGKPQDVVERDLPIFLESPSQ